MSRMRDENVVAFIGPDEVCTTEALVASAWNLPMISFVICYFQLLDPLNNLDIYRNVLTQLFQINRYMKCLREL